MKTKNFTLFLALIAISLNVNALTFTSVKDGSWTAATTWDQYAVPTSADDVIIAGHIITIPRVGATWVASATGKVVGDYINYATNQYQVTAITTGTLGTSYPNHITGDVVNGGVTLRYVPTECNSLYITGTSGVFGTTSTLGLTVSTGGMMIDDGVVFKNSGPIYLKGDLTIMNNGTFTIGNALYCPNMKIYPGGVLNSTSNASAGFSSMNIGYVGTALGAEGNNYTLQNDGVLGGSAATPDVADGIRIGCNYQANVTIKGTGVCNIGTLLAGVHTSGAKNSTVSIEQNMNFRTPTVACLTANAAAGFTTTFTIQKGATVSLLGSGCYFHATSASTGNLSNIIYNIYGTLDLSSGAAFGLSANSYAGNKSSLTVNVGDGSGTGDGGTLKFGNIITMVKQAAQTMAINANPYSTIVFGGTAAPVRTLTNATLPGSYYNMIVNNVNGITLPHASTINGVFTAMSGKLTLGAYNLYINPTGGSIAAGSLAQIDQSGIGKVINGLPNAVITPSSFNGKIFTAENKLIAEGLTAGDKLSVYTINGQSVTEVTALETKTSIALNSGVYLAKVQSGNGLKTFKVVIK